MTKFEAMISYDLFTLRFCVEDDSATITSTFSSVFCKKDWVAAIVFATVD